MKSTMNSTPIRTDHREQEMSGETLEQIRMRAYELFEMRGRQDGHDMDDWLQAEADVRQKPARRAAA